MRGLAAFFQAKARPLHRGHVVESQEEPQGVAHREHDHDAGQDHGQVVVWRLAVVASVVRGRRGGRVFEAGLVLVTRGQHFFATLAELNEDAGVAEDEDDDGDDGGHDEVGPHLVVVGVRQVAGQLRLTGLINGLIFGLGGKS